MAGRTRSWASWILAPDGALFTIAISSLLCLLSGCVTEDPVHTCSPDRIAAASDLSTGAITETADAGTSPDTTGDLPEYPGAPRARTAFDCEAVAIPWVKDGLGPEDADFTGSTSQLAATWAAVSGAGGYEYAIGTERGARDIADWTFAGTDTSITRFGLALSSRCKYYLQVRIWYDYGVSVATSSDGIVVDTDPPISYVYPLPDTLRTGHGGVWYITIGWGGVDRLSGIDYYDVQFRRGYSGEWQDAIVGTTSTSVTIKSNGGRYQFRCRAADKVGNLEPYPYWSDAETYQVSGYEWQSPPPTWPYNLKVALHLVPHSAASCKNLPVIPSRADLVRSWPSPGTDLDVFVVVFAYDSLSAFVYGLDWPAEWGSGSTRTCADLVIGDLDQPGDGLSLGWNTCRARGEAPAFLPVAWTWLAPSTEGRIWITYDPVIGPEGGLGGFDCRDEMHQVFHYPDSLFCAAVGQEPLMGVRRRESGAGRIQALFK